MCLAIPAQVVSIDGKTAIVDFGGVKRTVSIALMEKLSPGDDVIVHTVMLFRKWIEKKLKRAWNYGLKSLQVINPQRPNSFYELFF